MDEEEKNLPAKQDANAGYLQRYAGADPFATFANESGPGLVGKRLACVKGDWQLGQDAEPVAAGTLMLAVVTEARRGWIRFGSTGVDAADVGLVRDGFLMKHRMALGDVDESQWATDPTGKPRDPWAKFYSCLMIEVSAPHSECTFTSNSWGGQGFLQELCRVYAGERHAHPDCYPVIALAVKTRPTAHGKVKGPWLELKGWATVEDIKSGRKAAASPKPALAKANKIKAPTPAVELEIEPEAETVEAPRWR